MGRPQFIVDRPLTEVITQVIECGGDADTNASIAGQIAGAPPGFKQIATFISPELSAAKKSDG
jgi:ADP-ribosylglycohydrolase